MLERLRVKVESERYDENTAILVFLTEARRIDMYYRAQLVQQTLQFLRQAKTKVPAVYDCYWADYIIDAVYPERS